MINRKDVNLSSPKIDEGHKKNFAEKIEMIDEEQIIAIDIENNQTLSVAQIKKLILCMCGMKIRFIIPDKS